MALEVAIDVEENDWTDWDDSAPTPSSGNRWEVVAAAALNSTNYGMRYTAANSAMTGDGGATVTNKPAGGEYFRVAFYINRSTIAYAGTNNNQIIEFLNITDDTYMTAEISLGYQGSWEIEARVLSTGSTQTYLTAGLGTGERTVELRGLRSSSDGQTDGGYWLYVNGALVDSLTGIDNFDEVKPDFVRLVDERGGASQAPTGVFYLDEIQLREDDTPIYPETTVTHAWHYNGSAWADIGDSSTWGANIVEDLHAIPGTSFAEMIAAASTGVYRTTDTGSTWTSRSTLDATPAALDLIDGPNGYDGVAYRKASGGTIRVELISNLESGTVTETDWTDNHSTTGAGSAIEGVA